MYVVLLSVSNVTWIHRVDNERMVISSAGGADERTGSVRVAPVPITTSEDGYAMIGTELYVSFVYHTNFDVIAAPRRSVLV
jgi:hypothetical protein